MKKLLSMRIMREKRCQALKVVQLGQKSSFDAIPFQFDYSTGSCECSRRNIFELIRERGERGC